MNVLHCKLEIAVSTAYRFKGIADYQYSRPARYPKEFRLFFISIPTLMIGLTIHLLIAACLSYPISLLMRSGSRLKAVILRRNT
jgi:hypothetical protein